MAEESLYAQFCMLLYLRESREWKTVKEILNHLQDNTTWGGIQLEKELPDGGLRNVQNWLKNIRDSSDFENLILCERDPTPGEAFRYRSTPRIAGRSGMSIKEVCFILMAEKYLVEAMPKDFHEESLHALFLHARSILAKYEKRPPQAKRAVKSYIKRITIVPRGQQLAALQEHVPRIVLNIIYEAILNNRCVEIRYKNKLRVLHPYAIVIREPKFYLLGVDDEIMAETGPNNATPFSYLCNRIEDASVSEQANQVPFDFNATDYIKKGRLDIDVNLRDEMKMSGRRFTLKIRIFENNIGNMLQDLEEFPLSKKQTIKKESGKKSFLLTASDMRATHQLVEWIVGRMDDIEVRAPLKLRAYVSDKIAAMHHRYVGN